MNFASHHTIARSLRIVHLFFKSDRRRTAIGWVAAIGGVMVTLNGLNLANSFVGRDFMTAVANRRPRQFVLYAAFYALVFVGSAVAAAASRFCEERLRLLWREWTTRDLIGRYLHDRAFYRLKDESSIDNPDQRMTDDVKAFTQTALGFAIMSVSALIAAISFLGVLWTITPWLVLTAIVYAGVGTGLAVLLGRPLVSLNNAQLKKEADLRFGLIRVREAAEPVAVADPPAEAGAAGRLSHRITALVANNTRIIGVTFRLVSFTGGYNYMVQLIPILIVAPMFMRHEIEFGVVTQSAMAFAQVLGALSIVITQFEALSSFAAVGERLDAMYVALDADRDRPPTGVETVDKPDGGLALENVTLAAPHGDAPLVRDVSLTIPAGGRLIVTGPNVAARRALFLAMAGLWHKGAGRIALPARERRAFLPRDPLATDGSFRTRLAPAGRHDEPSEDAIASAIRAVGLDAAVARLGGLDADPDNQLSTDERHMLAYARLHLSPPELAVLDHTVESLSRGGLAPLLRSLADSSIGYACFCDDASLAGPNDVVLEIREDGGWSVTPRPAAGADPQPSA